MLKRPVRHWRRGIAFTSGLRYLSGDAQRLAATDGPHSQGKDDTAPSARGGPKGSFLARHGRDLTYEAAHGLLDPVLGREDVVERCLQILLRRTKNNPVLIGDPGVGKTAVAEGLAQLLAGLRPASSGLHIALPPGLQGRRMVALDVGSLVAGTQYRGALEERLQGVLREVRASRGGVILFIDELHMLVNAGRVEGGTDAANLLKPALARGELHCIGATTVEEYRKHIEADAAFARRFQAVLVEEPSPEAALACLVGLQPRYEAHHGVRFTQEALSTAVTAAQRYIPDRRLPDSAIDIIDQAASRVRLKAAAAGGAAAPAAAAEAAGPVVEGKAGGAASAAGAAALGVRDPISSSLGAASPTTAREAGVPQPGTVRPSGRQPRAGPAAHQLAGLRAAFSPPLRPNHSGRTPDEERELLEWFGGTMTQRAGHSLQVGHMSGAEAAAVGLVGTLGRGRSEAWDNGQAGASAVIGGVWTPETAVGTAQQAAVGAKGAGRGSRLQRNLSGVEALPCPHCGTPAPPKEGSLTIVCRKCRAAFLAIPSQKLMLGASLFLKSLTNSSGTGAPLPSPAASSSNSFGHGISRRHSSHDGVSIAGPAEGEQLWPPATQSQSAAPFPPTRQQQQQQLGQQLREQKQSQEPGEDRRPIVGSSEVLAVVAEGAGVPLAQISQSDWESLLSLEARLRQQVAGQDLAVQAVASTVQLGRLGLQRGRRPLASFVLAGPRGVGRSTLCKALATSLFASDRSLLRFDMSECSDRTAVSRLVGAPPGYVGFGDGGALTEAVRRRAHSVVVFDHAERAHPEVLNLLLQAVEHGQLSDSMGRIADFRNAVVVFSATVAAGSPTRHSTSEPASSGQASGSSSTARQSVKSTSAKSTSVPILEHDHRLLHQTPDAGPHHAHTSSGALPLPSHAAHSAAALSLAPQEAPTPQLPGSIGSRHGAAQHASHSALPPELTAAVDAVVQLGPLDAAAMQQVVAMQLQECMELLRKQGVSLQVHEGVQQWLASRGNSAQEGARPLQRLLRQHVLGPAAEAMLEHRVGLAAQGHGGPVSPVGLQEEGAGCNLVLTVDARRDALVVSPA